MKHGIQLNVQETLDEMIQSHFPTSTKVEAEVMFLLPQDSPSGEAMLVVVWETEPDAQPKDSEESAPAPTPTSTPAPKPVELYLPHGARGWERKGL